MNIQNLTVTGPAAGFQLCTNSNFLLYGILFNDASGTVATNVTIDHIFQFQNGAFGSCQTGRAIRAEGITGARTVTITNTTARDYQKTAFEARSIGTGSMTMNVSNSTAGPPHSLEGLMAQNGVTYVGAAGSGEQHDLRSRDAQPGVGGNSAGTAVLLSGAHDVTVTNNTLTSPAAPRPGADIGISVSAGSSTRIVISFNRVDRFAPTFPTLRSQDRCLHPGWLAGDVDLQHLQPLDHERRRMRNRLHAPRCPTAPSAWPTGLPLRLSTAARTTGRRAVPHRGCHAVHLDD